MHVQRSDRGKSANCPVDVDGGGAGAHVCTAVIIIPGISIYKPCLDEMSEKDKKKKKHNQPASLVHNNQLATTKNKNNG